MNTLVRSVIFLALFSIQLPYAQAQTNTKLRDQLQQLKLLLSQIQNNFTSSNSFVYLGTEQTNSQSANETLQIYINQLTNTLSSEPYQPKNFISELKWLPATNLNLPNEQLVNAASSGQNVNICRAPFIGASVQNNAMYPGQLLKEGCRISYAGYAFIFNKFDVLAGISKNLKWISINDVKSNMNVPSNTNNVNPDSSISALSSGMMQAIPSNPYQPFNFDIKINGAKPIAGGYEGGRPVLICRTKQNGIITIGKLVFFVGVDNKQQDACDIGIDNKEVVIQKDYELLFWKSTSST